MKKRIALLVLSVLVLVIAIYWLSVIPVGPGGCRGKTPITTFTVTQTGEQTAQLTHYNGNNLPTNQTFVSIGSTTRRWASLQSSAGDAVVTAGDNVTVSRREDEQLRVSFQRPPPTRHPFTPYKEPCYTTRNVTLDIVERDYPVVGNDSNGGEYRT